MSQYPSNPNPGDAPRPNMYEVPAISNGAGDNPMGRAALGLGVGTMVLQVIGQAMWHRVGVMGVSWLGLGATLVALVAVILGIIGLRTPGGSRAAAGIGLGIGGYVVVMAVVNVVFNVVLFGL